MDRRERELVEMVRARPDDRGARAVLEDHLLERGHPGARFVALDRELCDVPRDAPRFCELDAELGEVAATLPPAWLMAVGERDAARFDVVGTSRESMIGTLVRAGIDFRMAEVDRCFERGLRRIDARVLAGGLGPQIGLVPNAAVSALARLRNVLPRPHHWQIRQPAFNQMWHPRGAAHQRTPPAAEVWVDDEVDVVLRDRGPAVIQAIKTVRALTGLGLKEAKELTEAGGTIAEDVGRSRANEMVEALREAGAIAEIAGGYEPAASRDEFDAVRGGDPTIAAVRATDDLVAVCHFRWRFIGGHDAAPDLRPELELPIEAVRSDTDGLLAAFERIRAERLAGFACGDCGETFAPEYGTGGRCGRCAEAHGIVH